MNTLIITNVWLNREVNLVKSLNERFNPNFRIVTPLDINFGILWKVSDSIKNNVEWTKRYLRKFIEESSYDILVKIDPDTVIKTLPEMPEDCDVAGDFRKTGLGWIWFGACQYYTKNAVEQILSDNLFTGMCRYQDIELAKSIKRLNLRAYNMDEIDGWSKEGSVAQVTHRQCTPINRLPSGFITMN